MNPRDPRRQAQRPILPFSKNQPEVQPPEGKRFPDLGRAHFDPTARHQELARKLKAKKPSK